MRRGRPDHSVSALVAAASRPTCRVGPRAREQVSLLRGIQAAQQRESEITESGLLFLFRFL
jgi:hypothetical protein